MFSGVCSMQISTITTVSVFFRVCDFPMWALSLGSLSAGSLSWQALSLLSFFFPFLLFDLGLPVMYTRFKSVVVASWRSASMLPGGTVKE